MQSIFSNQPGRRLEINNKQIWKFKNMWKLNTFLDNKHVKAEVSRIRKQFQMNENKSTTYKISWVQPQQYLKEM